ncbi:MAG: GTPase domain-containing protein [Phycisphaerales bacterium]|nr:GTPase domain-containing protein [Phycisphaerales bacterium]
MLEQTRQIVMEAAALIGESPPRLMEGDAPVLNDAVLDPTAVPKYYLVGLIGGKNVGKSTLINALVGEKITLQSTHGAGTEKVIAYAHAAQAAALRELLEREVPGQYEIVTHEHSQRMRQVLLDLPDIDSHYEFHVAITRRMLRHMLYPVFIQSVEKYADRKPRELLSAITEGNDPRNYVFVLNKIDQILASEGPEGVRQLGEEYASRLTVVLGIASPKVWMISALDSSLGELVALRESLAKDQSPQTIAQSSRLAAQRQVGSLLTWLEGQKMDRHLATLERLENDAREEVMARLGGPLIERMHRLIDDPTLHMGLADEAMDERVKRWPIVNVLHQLLGPMLSVLRYRLPIPRQRGLADIDTLVAPYLNAKEGPARQMLQATFAQLHQTHPMLSRLYRDNRWWGPEAAEQAVSELHRQLTATLNSRRDVLHHKYTKSGGAISASARILITWGALLWFPFVQPVLEAYLADGSLRNFALLFVRVLGATYLLQNVGLLAVYFLVIWLILKWHTQRHVDRLLEKWKEADEQDPEQSLAGTIMIWVQRMLAPISRTRQRMALLLQQSAELRRKLSSSGA